MILVTGATGYFGGYIIKELRARVDTPIAVLVRGDKVLAVGESVPQPGNAVEVRLRGVLAPGFVDAFSTWGAGDGVAENSRSITPRLIAGDSLDLDRLTVRIEGSFPGSTIEGGVLEGRR